MNSPYYGKFKVSQRFKGFSHDGLDLVGIDSKNIHSTVNGTVIYAGWENPSNHKQGFGQYVKIQQENSVNVHYFGHLSQIKVKTGDKVKITDIIGVEGSTGYSTGSHCHYCIRKNGIYGQHINVSEWTGIPNIDWVTCDDGFRPAPTPAPSSPAGKSRTYTVQNGDSLWGIAQKQLGKGSRYREIMEINGFTEKTIIHPGDIIALPD